jgi:hypothetical protein
MLEGREGGDCLIMEVLSERASDHSSGVTLTREGVAADPYLMTGAEVRGEAEAGRVALSHESVG